MNSDERVSRDELVAALRDWADDTPNDVAAVELLISHDLWLDRATMPLPLSGALATMRIITTWWAMTAHMVDDTQYPTADRAVLKVARSLAGCCTVDLGEVLADCGTDNAALIAAAVTTAAGDDDGGLVTALWRDRTDTT